MRRKIDTEAIIREELRKETKRKHVKKDVMKKMIKNTIKEKWKSEKERRKLEKSDEESETEEGEEKKKPVIIKREQWAAESPRGIMRVFKKLPSLVRVCSTGSPGCNGFLECCAAVQHIQSRDFDEKLPDIKYNFIVSPDGTIFEGRSWRTIPFILGQRYRSTCLVVAIIGEYEDMLPPRKSLAAVGALLTQAVKDKHIDRYFKILPFQSYKIPKEEPRKERMSFSEFDSLESDIDLFE